MAESVAIRVEGGKRIAYGLRKTADNLEDLSPGKAARVMLIAARLRAPVRTGELRMSGQVVGNGIAFYAPYAGPIHWGWPKRNILPNPFALRGVEESRAVWEAIYAGTIQDDLDLVEGA